MFRLPALLCFLSLIPLAARAEPTADARALLASAVATWASDVDRWSFVQHVEEYGRGGVTEVRVERFDPSRPDSRRWELLSINNQPPSVEQRRAFDARKNAKPRKRLLEPARYVDFDRVRIVRETAETVTLDVPLRGDVSFFIPFEAIGARLEIDRATSRIRRVEVGLVEEMRIAFGMARVTRLDMAFAIEPSTTNATDAPADQPTGRASASLTRFGRRVELSWSDFARVDS